MEVATMSAGAARLRREAARMLSERRMRI